MKWVLAGLLIGAVLVVLVGQIIKRALRDL